jgi:hypothetical protein
MVSRLAISGLAPASSAQTYLPFAPERSDTEPSAFETSVNCSQPPTASRSATSGAAPAFAAQTYLPVRDDFSATRPPPASTIVKPSVAPGRPAKTGPPPATQLNRLNSAIDHHDVADPVWVTRT